jgi:heme-degrading monooxygenase HmoA
MSVSVHVRHFFNREGLTVFPVLFEQHRRSVAVFPGFISLQHSGLSTTELEDTIDVTLEFESKLLLKKWRSSSQHEQIAAQYRRHWTREPEIAFSSPRSEILGPRNQPATNSSASRELSLHMQQKVVKPRRAKPSANSQKHLPRKPRHQHS